MKKLLSILLMTSLCACDGMVEKPKNLIPEDKMVDILYDAALLEAMRTQRPFLITQQQINPKEYLYKKYGIDSLQLAQSNRYYASDIDKYTSMYEKVAKRLEEDRKKTEAGTEKQKALAPEAPRVE